MQKYQSNDTWVITLVIRMVGLWAILTGIAVSIGGRLRWSAPVYETLHYMPGSPQTWAIWLGLAGIAVFVGSYLKTKIQNVGLNLIALWCLILAVGIATELGSPTVSYDMPLLYIFIAVLSLALAKARK